MIFAIVGGVLVGIGLLSGVMLALFGGVSQIAFAVAHVVVGAVLIAYALFTNFAEIRDRVVGEAGRRSIWEGGNALAQAGLVALLLAGTAYLSVRYPVRWDLTESGIHSITEASRGVLAQIPEDEIVEVYAFYSDPIRVRSLLELYAYASDRFRFRIIAPNEEPQLAALFEIFQDGMMVICGGPCRSEDGVARATVKTTALSEQKVTESIRSVISDAHKIYFVTGHDEADPADTGIRGLSGAADALRGENVDYDLLLLAQTGQIPDDADAVVIVAPSLFFFAPEIEALDAYLRRGGSVFLLLDALERPKIREALARWSIEVTDDVVAGQKPGSGLLGDPVYTLEVVTADYAEAHPIASKMRGLPVLFQMARSVEPAPGAERVEILVSAPDTAYAAPDTDLRSGDALSIDPAQARKGPISLVVARTFANQVDPEGREGRLVVAGDADFASNGYIGQGANYDLFLNAVSWLVGEESFMSVDRQLPRASRATISAREMRVITYGGAFVIPEVILIVGILAWWRRRR